MVYEIVNLVPSKYPHVKYVKEMELGGHARAPGPVAGQDRAEAHAEESIV